MEISHPSSSIAQAHLACIDAFQSLLDNIPTNAPGPHMLVRQKVHHAFDKYNLWAGNMGAMNSGQRWEMSLDYRLREASFYKVQVLRLLKDLKASVEKAQSSVLGTKALAHGISSDKPDAVVPDDSELDESPWEVSSDSEADLAIYTRRPRTAAGTIVQNASPNIELGREQDGITQTNLINYVISCLWKLPIRRPAPLDRVKERAAAETSDYQPFDIMHVKNKFPAIDEKLAVRLGKMISRRRQIMRYRKRHTNALLDKHLQTRRPIAVAIHDQADESFDVAPSLLASTRYTHDTKATTFKVDVLDRIPSDLSSLYAPTMSTSISSIGSDQSECETPMAVPKRPKGDGNDASKQFICPYCRTAQSIGTDRKWRKHVLVDLQPYVCTYLDCSLHEHVFDNREEWWQHETQSHRFEWSCNCETHGSFKEVSDFIVHMNNFHHDVLQDNQLPALKHVFQRPTHSQEGVCNLCGKLTNKLKSHLAKHLKELALFAIPQTDYMVESDTEDAKSDRAHRSNIASENPEYSEIESISATRTDTRQVSEENPGLDIRSVSESSAPPVLNDEDAHATSWDFATSKFQDARAAMYGIDKTAVADTHSKPSKEDLNTQKDKSAGLDTIAFSADLAVVNPYFQQRPICGASIGAYRGEHLPPVSLGGIILIDGEPYGLTVHHILDIPSDDESDEKIIDTEEIKPENPRYEEAMEAIAQDVRLNEVGANKTEATEKIVKEEDTKKGSTTKESKSPKSLPQPEDTLELTWDLELSDDSAAESDAPELDGAETEWEFSDSDEEEDKRDNTVEDASGSDQAVGDLPGIQPGEGEHIKITQPAIDDVDEDFFPNAEDRDEDHLSSHEYGHIFASSGIRRWRRDGIVHEIDWALIKVNPDRLQPFNVVQGGKRFRFGKMPDPPPLYEPVSRRHYTPEEDEYPMEVADADSLGGLKVHCVGRTTGLHGGMIGRQMASVRIYRRKTFSRSWYVTGGFGVGGDTGAWVIDNSGRVCGIVLAWCHRNHIAYIQPMQVVLEDIQRTLGATDVCLPRYPPKQVPSSKEDTEASWTSHDVLPHLQLGMKGRRASSERVRLLEDPKPLSLRERSQKDRIES